jgi:hypothetical protein
VAEMQSDILPLIPFLETPRHAARRVFIEGTLFEIAVTI